MILRVVIFITLGLLIFLAIQKILFSLMRKKLLERLEKRFVADKIIQLALNANFFGQKSKGLKQIRGKGVLVLTKDELWFSLAVPEREISIPLKHIKSVGLTRSHLGKRVFRPLLYVEYFSQVGEDSIAWYVNNPEKWIAAIEKTKKESLSPFDY